MRQRYISPLLLAGLLRLPSVVCQLQTTPSPPPFNVIGYVRAYDEPEESEPTPITWSNPEATVTTFEYHEQLLVQGHSGDLTTAHLRCRASYRQYLPISGTITSQVLNHLCQEGCVEVKVINENMPVGQRTWTLYECAEYLSSMDLHLPTIYQDADHIPLSQSAPPSELTNTSTSDDDNDGDDGLSPETVAAVVVGTVVGMILIAVGVGCYVRRATKRAMKEESTETARDVKTANELYGVPSPTSKALTAEASGDYYHRHEMDGQASPATAELMAGPVSYELSATPKA